MKIFSPFFLLDCFFKLSQVTHVNHSTPLVVEDDIFPLERQNLRSRLNSFGVALFYVLYFVLEGPAEDGV